MFEHTPTSTPKVSAIILTHNRLSLLKRAVDSVISQTYSNIEKILVIDASTDGTVDYCEQLSDFKIIYIPPDESKGGNYARNKGILAATGEYLAFLDDDDYWLSEKIEQQVIYAQRNDYNLVYCRGKIENVSKNGDIIFRDFPLSEQYQGDSSRFIMTKSVYQTSQVLVKRSLVIKAGLFDENLHFWQDYELEIRLAQMTSFHLLDKFLMVYRFDNYDPQRLSNHLFPWIKDVHTIHTKHRKLYSQLSYSDKLKVIKMIYKDGMYRLKKKVKSTIDL